MSSKGDINAQLTLFTQQLKRHEIGSGKDVALATAEMLKRFVKARRWTSIDMMIEQIRLIGSQLVNAQPHEFTIGNVVRRVLKSIRTIDETYLPSNQDQQDDSIADDEEVRKGASMFGLLSVEEKLTSSGLFANSEARNEARDRRDAVVNEIDFLIDEIQNDDPLFKSAIEMINPHDVILVPCPASKTVFDFLIRASSKKKHLSVIITESYPNKVEAAKEAAKRLNENGVAASLVPDSTVYAVMAKVSKVLVGARAVLANGGCITSSGVAMACHAAKQFRKPVLVISGSYKLSPLYPFDCQSLIEIGNSGKVIDYADADLMDNLEVVNPLFDYIQPELVDIVITADGGVSPNFIYRLVLDNYSVQDQKLTD